MNDQPTFDAVPPLPNPADEPGCPASRLRRCPAPAAAPQSRAKPAAVTTRLSRARAQVPPADLRRPDRPGRDGAHLAQRLRDRAASRRPVCSPACAASARRRRRASWRAALNYRAAGRLGRARPSIMPRATACIAAPSWNRAMSTCSRWTPPPTPASTTSARSSTASATRRPRRATRSTSSTKSTCSRSRRSTRFLKTLEEPPPHAKFIFATTEIRKVPVTILSRCQRFDLRRIDAALLVQHLGRICAKEGVGRRAGGAGA